MVRNILDIILVLLLYFFTAFGVVLFTIFILFLGIPFFITYFILNIIEKLFKRFF